MPRRSSSQVITSNALMEGDAIYLASNGGWTRKFDEARLFTDPEEADRALSAADSQRDLHVGAYLADAAIGPDGHPEPVHFREVFRTLGPSNYFHGKQAGN